MNVQRFLSLGSVNRKTGTKRPFRERTKQTYGLILGCVNDWLTENGYALETVQPEQFDAYLDSKATTSYRRLILSCVQGYLWTMGHRDAPLLGKASISAEPPVEMRTLQDDAVDKVLAFLSANRNRKSYKRTTAMLLLSIEGQLRASEICSLTFAALDLEGGWVTVIRKGGKKRTISPILSPTVAAIEQYLAVRPPGGELVFVSDEGKRIERNAWRLCCLRLAKAAGVPHFSPHSLRRTGTCAMEANGAPQGLTMKIAGWSEDSMYQRYTMGQQMERARPYMPSQRYVLPVELMPTAGIAVPAEVEA